MKPLRWALAGTLAMMAASTSAQIFECTDAHGAKLYAEQCPPGTVSERQVVKRGEMTPQSGGAPAPKSLELQNAEFRKRQMEREEAEAKQAKEETKAADARKNCDEARAQLKALEVGQRIARIDPETGERAVLEDDQRPAEIERARKLVEEWCRSP